MAYQFAHVDWAARKRSSTQQSRRANSMQTRSAGWSAADLAGEAMRLPGHCAHVAEPLPPTILHGVDPVAAAREAEAWGAQAKDASGRRWRSDAPVLAAGVVSWPRERIDEWPAYRDAVVDALRERYGDRLRSVVEHLDEAHPHLHFYAVPRPGEGFAAVHDGYAASRAARGQPGNLIRTAYNDAMRAWQDWLHDATGRRHGLDRIGPARERRERDEHLLETGKEQLLADREQLAGELRQVRRDARDLERKAADLDAEQQRRLVELRHRERELKDARAALDGETKAALEEARKTGLVQGRRMGLQRGFNAGLRQAAEVRIGERLGAAWRELRRALGGAPERERELAEQARQAADRETRLSAELAAAKSEARALRSAVRDERAERVRLETISRRMDATLRQLGFGPAPAPAPKPEPARPADLRPPLRPVPKPAPEPEPEPAERKARGLRMRP